MEGSPEKTGKASLAPRMSLNDGSSSVTGGKCCPGRSGGDEGGYRTLREAAVDGQRHPWEGREVQVTQTRVDGDWELERTTEELRRCRRRQGWEEDSLATSYKAVPNHSVPSRRQAPWNVLKGVENLSLSKTRTQMFIAALLIIAQNRSNQNYRSQVNG